jgi:hypothetical protein
MADDTHGIPMPDEPPPEGGFWIWDYTDRKWTAVDQQTFLERARQQSELCETEVEATPDELLTLQDAIKRLEERTKRAEAEASLAAATGRQNQVAIEQLDERVTELTRRVINLLRRLAPTPMPPTAAAKLADQRLAEELCRFEAAGVNIVGPPNPPAEHAESP